MGIAAQHVGTLAAVMVVLMPAMAAVMVVIVVVVAALMIVVIIIVVVVVIVIVALMIIIVVIVDRRLLVIVLVLIVIAADLRTVAGRLVLDRVRAVAERGEAVIVGGRGIVVHRRAVRQFDHVLVPEGTDDRVVTAVRLEHDAVRRAQSRDVDRVVPGLAIDGDGVEAQAGGREVADDVEGIAAGRARRPRRIDAVDADLLDLAKLRDDVAALVSRCG